MVQNKGQRNVKRKVKCYNLDTIIVVGYRVNSKKVIRIRQWTTKTLKDYISEFDREVEKYLKGENL